VKRLCTILARGGSKGVPHKNIRELCGKPLIAHSIEQAFEAGLFDEIAVSSDSDEILNVAARCGVLRLVKRPEDLANDKAPKIPAIRHCVTETEKLAGFSFDTITDLDPTSPFREKQDIITCVELLESTGISNVITGAPSRKSPYFNLVEIDGAGRVVLSKPPAGSIVRRQDSPACYDLNASIYVWRRETLFAKDSVFFEDTRLYVMPRERSIEIDEEIDFRTAAYFMTKKGNP